MATANAMQVRPRQRLSLPFIPCDPNGYAAAKQTIAPSVSSVTLTDIATRYVPATERLIRRSSRVVICSLGMLPLPSRQQLRHNVAADIRQADLRLVSPA